MTQREEELAAKLSRLLEAVDGRDRCDDRLCVSHCVCGDEDLRRIADEVREP